MENWQISTSRVLSEDRLKKLKEQLDSLEGKCSKPLALSNRPDIRAVDHDNIQGALTSTRPSWMSSWPVPVEKEIPKTDLLHSSESNSGISTTVVDVCVGSGVRHQHHLDPRSPARILSLKAFNPNASLAETGMHARGSGEYVRENENQGAWMDQGRERTACETSMVKSREITEGGSGRILETVLQLNTMITENRAELDASSLLSAKIVTLPRETAGLDELSCRSLGIKDQITMMFQSHDRRGEGVRGGSLASMAGSDFEYLNDVIGRGRSEEVDDKEELDGQTEDHCIEREGEPTRLLDTRFETPHHWSDTFAPHNSDREVLAGIQSATTGDEDPFLSRLRDRLQALDQMNKQLLHPDLKPDRLDEYSETPIQQQPASLYSHLAAPSVNSTTVEKEAASRGVETENILRVQIVLDADYDILVPKSKGLQVCKRPLSNTPLDIF